MTIKPIHIYPVLLESVTLSIEETGVPFHDDKGTQGNRYDIREMPQNIKQWSLAVTLWPQMVKPAANDGQTTLIDSQATAVDCPTIAIDYQTETVA